MPNKITSTIEQHPVISSLILGGAGLGIAIIIAKKQSTSNSTSSSICTDSAGNPVDCTTGQALSGATVSPGLSSSDTATMLQDLEQQILNWEQTFGQQQSTNNGNNNGNNGPSVCKMPGTCPKGSTIITGPDGCPKCGPIVPSGGENPPAASWFRRFLSGGSGNTFNPNATPGLSTDSYYKLPTALSSRQLAAFFGIGGATPWAGIAYNPHNRAILNQAFQTSGNALIPAGTAVWIPTSLIPD